MHSKVSNSERIKYSWLQYLNYLFLILQISWHAYTWLSSHLHRTQTAHRAIPEIHSTDSLSKITSWWLYKLYMNWKIGQTFQPPSKGSIFETNKLHRELLLLKNSCTTSPSQYAIAQKSFQFIGLCSENRRWPRKYSLKHCLVSTLCSYMDHTRMHLCHSRLFC